MGGELMQCFGLELGNTHQCLKYTYPKYSLWNLSYRDICAVEQEYGQGWTFQVVLVVKNLPANAGDREAWVQSLGWQASLEKGMATHSSILAWRIPWTEETDDLQFQVAKSQTQLKPLSMHAYTRMLIDVLSGLWCQKKWSKQIVHHQMVPVYEKYHVAAKQNEVKLCTMIQKGVYHILSRGKKSKL